MKLITLTEISEKLNMPLSTITSAAESGDIEITGISINGHSPQNAVSASDYTELIQNIKRDKKSVQRAVMYAENRKAGLYQRISPLWSLNTHQKLLDYHIKGEQLELFDK